MNIFDVLYARQTGKTRPRAKITDNLLGLALAGGGYEEKTIDFTPVISISDAKAGNALDFQCKITAVQSGTNPSPDNICPITGWTGANISVNGSTVSVSWQSEAGTVYGGVLDATTGELTVTHTIVDLGQLSYVTTSWGAFRATLSGALPVWDSDIAKALAEKYAVTSYRNLNRFTPVNQFAIYTVSTGVSVYVCADESPTGLLTYELANPITYTLTPTEITLVAGVNTLWADTGDSKMTYLAKK